MDTRRYEVGIPLDWCVVRRSSSPHNPKGVVLKLSLHHKHKKMQKLTSISTPLSILTAVIVGLAATVGALFSRLRAQANPEKHALKTIADATEKAEEAIDNLPESTRRGSSAIQNVSPHLDAIRTEVERARVANGTNAPALSH